MGEDSEMEIENIPQTTSGTFFKTKCYFIGHLGWEILQLFCEAPTCYSRHVG